MEYNDVGESEIDYLPEYSNLVPSKNYIKTNKPVNSLDYLKFHSEEYLKYKLEQKVKDRINGLNLGDKYIKEVFEIVYYNHKLLKERQSNNPGLTGPRVSDIISIVVYKIIKKYNLPVSHNEIFGKISLDKSKYLKFSNMIKVSEGGESLDDINKIVKREIDDFGGIDALDPTAYSYGNKLFNYLSFIISRLYEVFKYKPNSFKIKTEKVNLDTFFKNFENKKNNSTTLSLKEEDRNYLDNYLDSLKLLEEVKQEAKEIIFNRETRSESFYSFFGNRILSESLAAGIVKYLMEKRGVKINLQIFRENFKIPMSGISKAIKMIEEYIKL